MTDYPQAKDVAGTQHFTPGRNGAKIQWIVLHHNDGQSSASGVLAAFNHNGTSAHYDITTDGQVWQFVKESDVAYHASGDKQDNFPAPANRNASAINFVSIGIEHEDATPALDGTLTQKEKYASVALITYLCKKYGIPAVHGSPTQPGILKHSDVSHTLCPGANFPFNEIVAKVSLNLSTPTPVVAQPQPVVPAPTLPPTPQNTPTITRGQFMIGVLAGLGNTQPSTNTLNFLLGWSAAEEGHISQGAAFNPLATTHAVGITTNYNTVGVKNFSNVIDGISATVSTLTNGHYPNLVHALQTNDEASLGFNGHSIATAIQQELSVWSTGKSSPLDAGYINNVFSASHSPAGLSSIEIVSSPKKVVPTPTPNTTPTPNPTPNFPVGSTTTPKINTSYGPLIGSAPLIQSVSQLPGYHGAPHDTTTIVEPVVHTKQGLSKLDIALIVVAVASGGVVVAYVATKGAK